MSYVIFDTEYTSWEGCNANGWHDWQKKEIVQIAAVRVDEADDRPIGELNLYVKPVLNPVLSDYFVSLTGISNQKIAAEGIGFADAYEQFKFFVGRDKCYSHGWSLSQDELADGKVMLENLELLGLKDCTPPEFHNIAPWFKEQYQAKGIHIEKQCSGEIAVLLGCTEEFEHSELDVHNALYDVYSILAGIRFLKKDEKKSS